MTAEELYRSAYDLHYTQKRHAEALEAYQKLIHDFPDALEAGYARSQVENLGQLIGATAEELTAAEGRKALQQYQEQHVAEIARNTPRDIPLTTAPFLEGYRVVETLEIVTSECAFGMNVFRDILAGMRDVFGGRSRATQKVLRDARQECLAELKVEARSIDADAVLGVSLAYNQLSGQGKSMVFLVASGTAVRLAARSEGEHLPDGIADGHFG